MSNIHVPNLIQNVGTFPAFGAAYFESNNKRTRFNICVTGKLRIWIGTYPNIEDLNTWFTITEGCKDFEYGLYGPIWVIADPGTKLAILSSIKEEVIFQPLISGEAQYVLDRMTDLTSERSAAIVKFVNSQVISGNWDKIDEFFCFAVDDLNWLTGWKSYTAIAAGNVLADIDGARAANNSVNNFIDLDIDLTGLTQFTAPDGALGIYLFEQEHQGTESIAHFGTRDELGSFTRLRHGGNVDNTLDARISSAAEVEVTGVLQDDMDKVLYSNVAQSGSFTIYADDAPIDGLETAVTTDLTGVNNLYLFTENRTGGPQTAGRQSILTSFYIGAGDIDLTDFVTNLDVLHTELGVDAPLNSPLPFDNSFETGRLITPREWIVIETSYDDPTEMIKIVDYESRIGQYCAEMTITESDPVWPGDTDKFRTELTPRPPVYIPGSRDTEDIGILWTTPVGYLRWYSFSIFIGSDWQIEEDIRFIVLAQWLSRMDACDDRQNSPQISLELMNDEELRVLTRWDENPCSNTPGQQPNFEAFSVGQLVKDVWTDWVFRVQWSWDNTGTITVWKNNDELVTMTGRGSCYNDELGSKFKVGIYSSDEYNHFPKRMLYDAVKIGDETATYEDMHPDGDSPN